MVKFHEPLPSRRKGQSLIEVLIGVTIAGILILSAAILTNVSQRSGAQSKEQQTATFLAQELLEQIATYAEGKWYCRPATCATTRGVFNLTKGPARRYYLDASANPIIWKEQLPNGETVTVSSQNYNRYFYVQDVCRSSSGLLALMTSDSGPGGNCDVTNGWNLDPSVEKVTVVVKWQKNGAYSEYQLENFVVRSRTAAIGQSDWSGGSYADCNSTILITPNPSKYACKQIGGNSGQINETSVPGSLSVN